MLPQNGSHPRIPSQAVESKTAVPPMVIRLFWSRRRGSNPRPQRPERCALPAALRLDFFKFLSIFVSGQTCGQATYFERFLEKCTARIVSVVKGFRGSKKLPRKALVGVPNAYLSSACIIFMSYRQANF